MRSRGGTTADGGIWRIDGEWAVIPRMVKQPNNQPSHLHTRNPTLAVTPDEAVQVFPGKLYHLRGRWARRPFCRIRVGCEPARLDKLPSVADGCVQT